MLPYVLIKLIAQYLNVADYLHFRATNKLTWRLPITHLRLKVINEQIPVGNYDKVTYYGNNHEHLKNSVFRNLKIISDFSFKLPQTRRLNLITNNDNWKIKNIKIFKTNNVILARKNRIFSQKGTVGYFFRGGNFLQCKIGNKNVTIGDCHGIPQSISIVDISVFKKIKIVSLSLHELHFLGVKKLDILRNIPANIHLFKNLTFLKIRYAFVKFIPDSVTVLKLVGCSLECNFPNNLKKLKLQDTSIGKYIIPKSLKWLKLIYKDPESILQKINKNDYYHTRIIIKC